MARRCAAVAGLQHKLEQTQRLRGPISLDASCSISPKKLSSITRKPELGAEGLEIAAMPASSTTALICVAPRRTNQGGVQPRPQ